MKRRPLRELKELNNLIIKNRRFPKESELRVSNYTQCQIIQYLYTNMDKEVYQKDFEEILKASKPTISGVLDTMEEKGLISRLHHKTARGKQIVLTPYAKEKSAQVVQLLTALEEKLVDGLSEEELDAFFFVIDKMKENILKEGLKHAQNVQES